jgi:hypothetical protein
MVRTTVIDDPKHAICLATDRVCHYFLNQGLEIRPRIAINTVAEDLSCPDDQCCLIDTGTMAFVLVFDVIRGVRSRRSSPSGPRLNTCLFVGANDDIMLGEVLAVPESIVQI